MAQQVLHHLERTAFSLFGSQLVQFALVWWLTEKTGSGLVLTMATLAAVLPQVVLGPFVGALVDRWDRRWTMILADGGVAGGALLAAWGDSAARWPPLSPRSPSWA